MPAPTVATYDAQSKIDAHTAFLALVDSGTAGSIKTYSAADVLLCTHTLTDPGGTVMAPPDSSLSRPPRRP